MRAVVLLVAAVILTRVDCQFWNFPKEIFEGVLWPRQAKNGGEKITTFPSFTTMSTKGTKIPIKTIQPLKETTTATFISNTTTTSRTIDNATTPKLVKQTNSTSRKQPQKPKPTTPVRTSISQQPTVKVTSPSPIWTTVLLTTRSTTTTKTSNTIKKSPVASRTEPPSTLPDTTTQESTGTTEEEPRDNHRVHEFYLNKREKPQVKISSNISQNLLPLPAGASAALVKPTKYHYYPHNQHIYLLPECAIQQVCNAVYVRLNWTQPLCACPSRYRDPCSASLNADDQHTTELLTDNKRRRALTLVKTCEPTTEMRVCRTPRDWSLLALQNIRTGKSHYLVICRCPETSILEGPMSHDQPTYASVPGIRVYGMMCVQDGTKRRGRPLRITRAMEDDLPFPWDKANQFAKTAVWN